MLLNGNYSHNNISNREFNSLNTKALYQDILFPRILLLKQISFDTKLGGLDNLTLVSLLSSVYPLIHNKLEITRTLSVSNTTLNYNGNSNVNTEILRCHYKQSQHTLKITKNSNFGSNSNSTLSIISIISTISRSKMKSKIQ